MGLARIRLVAATALAGALVVGGLVVSPAAHAAITGSHITTPSNPSFFIADNAAASQTFAISGTTSGSAAGEKVDIRCYTSSSAFTMVAGNVALNPDGSFSVASANLALLEDGPCQLRAVPAGSTPPDLTPFTGPTIGVGERDNLSIGGGPNNGDVYDYYVWAQQVTAAFDYDSLGSCGIYDGYLYSDFNLTTTTFYCNGGLLEGDAGDSSTRSGIQIDGANAYSPFVAESINPNATGLPAVSDTYAVDAATGNVVIHESDPLVKCSTTTYPPTAGSCPSFVSTGVTGSRTITQDHDGHISWITNSFASTDGKGHTLDLAWDNNQHFQDNNGDSSKLEYEFPGQSSFSMHQAGDSVSLPSSPGTIFVRMRGAPDGDTATGQGAIVYDRPATGAKFTFVQSFTSEFMLHQTGNVPAGGSTRFQFAYVQDYHSANVAALAKTARAAFLNTVTVSKSGKGKVTSSPGGIACGKTCKHSYAYGTLVTLKAKAAKGSRFAGWSGACKGKQSCKITVSGDAAVKAKFALRPCVVPNVVGKTLKAAKLAIRKAFCSVGKVTTVTSSAEKGRVVSQSPRHGKRVKQHTKISLRVSRG